MNNVETNKKAAVKFLQLIVDRKIDEAFQLVDMGGKYHSFFSTKFSPHPFIIDK